MPKYKAESWDANAVTKFLHERGHDHLRVRRRSDLLTIESGPENDPVKHARLRRVTVHLWTLEMATHKGGWEKTGLRDVSDALLTVLVDDFGWTLETII